jgi:release factor glutamine methyltransferase
VTLKQALARARKLLSAGKIEESELESEVLLKYTLGISRVELYQRLDLELSSIEEEKFWSLIKRRLNNEPTAYITGHREFYGLDFHINPSVLIPRPETELLVERAIDTINNRYFSISADIGTGCGAVAISLAVNLPQVKIYATDISPDALNIALQNCRKHGVEDRITLISGDLLEPLPEPVDLIVANLPYVRKSDLSGINTSNFEPKLALDGGEDGLEQIRRFIAQLKESKKLCPGGILLTEIGQGQSNTVASLLHQRFPLADIEVFQDLGGIERVVSLSLPTR